MPLRETDWLEVHERRLEAQCVGQDSFTSLLAELALIVRDTNRIPQTGATFSKTTRANPTQARALELGANPARP
jgi:hypothetical protein